MNVCCCDHCDTGIERQPLCQASSPPPCDLSLLLPWQRDQLSHTAMPAQNLPHATVCADAEKTPYRLQTLNYSDQGLKTVL